MQMHLIWINKRLIHQHFSTPSIMNAVTDLPRAAVANAADQDFAWAPGRHSPVPGAPPLSQLLAAATGLRPYLRERARQTDEDRRVSDASTDRFREAGFFKLMQPARYGGYEYGFTAMGDVISELGRACTSSSWSCSLGAIHQWLIGTFPVEAQDDVWGENPDAIICASYAPAVKAERVAGGYVIEGKWLWASNVDNSQWCMVGVQLPSDDGKTSQPGFLLVPRKEWEIEDNWYMAGQSGTGSKTVVINKKTFVPEHRKLTIAEASSNNHPDAGSTPIRSTAYRSCQLCQFALSRRCWARPKAPLTNSSTWPVRG